MEDKILKIGELAYKYEQNYGGCAQAVLAAFKEKCNFISDSLFKAATGFNGGVGLTGSICGALSGSILTMCSIHGREYNNLEDPKRVRYICYRMTKKLCDRFNKKYNSIYCRDIQLKIMGKSFDLWNEEDKKKFEKLGAHKDKCPSVCKSAAIWACEIMQGEKITI